jgi:hypothetical protein
MLSGSHCVKNSASGKKQGHLSFASNLLVLPYRPCSRIGMNIHPALTLTGDKKIKTLQILCNAYKRIMGSSLILMSRIFLNAIY